MVFQETLKIVSRQFQRRSKVVSRVFKESVKCVKDGLDVLFRGIWSTYVPT